MEELQLPLDQDGFSRRECPRCHAQFMVRWSEVEEQVLAAAMARRVATAGGEEPAPRRRFCPYCAAPAAAEAFFPAPIQRHLDTAARQITAEVESLRLRVPEEWLAANPRAEPAAPSLELPSLPPREYGADLFRIALPCCGDEQKVSDAWLGPVRCHLCGIAHLREGPRDFGLELALLKQWVE